MPEEFGLEAVLSYIVAPRAWFAWPSVLVDKGCLMLCQPRGFCCFHSPDSSSPPAVLQQLPGHFPLCHRQEGNLHPENVWEAPSYLLVLPYPLPYYYLSLKMQVMDYSCLFFASRLKQILKVTSSRSVNVMLHKVVYNILNFTSSDVRDWFILTTFKVILGRPPTLK